MRQYDFRLWVVLICAGVLGGCAQFHPRPLSPSQSAAAFEARTLDDPGLKRYLEVNLHRELAPWPPATWDLGLLTLAAFYYQPDLDLARAHWGVTEAGVITAGGRPNPSVGFTPQYDFNAVSGISPWTLSFSIDVPIETAGKRGLRLDQARHLSEAARLNIATVAWRVRSHLRSSLLDLYAAERTVSLLNTQRTRQEKVVAAVEERFAIGEVSRPDVIDARLALDRFRLAQREAQRQDDEARARLAEAIGLPIGALEQTHLSFDALDHLPRPIPLAPDELRRHALHNRSDLAAALADYAASQSALQLEIAKQYPDLHLGPGYSWDQGESKWSIGLSVTLPLLNQNQGPIAEAEARRTEAAARVMTLQTAILGELDRAIAGYRAARDSLTTTDALLAAQRQRRQSVQASFDNGEVDRLALLGAELEMDAAQRARDDAQIKAQQAVGTLEDAMQRPLDPAALVSAAPEANPRRQEASPNRIPHNPVSQQEETPK